MQLRTLLLFLGGALAAGCGGGGAGKIMAETPVPTKEDPQAVLVPYQPPDFAELTGIPEDDEDAEDDEDDGGEETNGDNASGAKAPAPGSKQ